MLKTLKVVIPGAILATGFLYTSVTPSFATQAYAKKEGQTCAYCHVTAGKPDLNDGGKYYAAHDHSLKGYTPAK